MANNCTNRSSNYELLRIVCMLMIICGHIIMYHKYDKVGDSSWYIGQIIRPFCMVAVNIFIIISGYFGIKLNVKKLWSLNLMVTFYCVAFLIWSLLSGRHTFSPRKDWMLLIPVVTKQYWFITDYFALCFLSPFLNKLVDVLDKNLFQRLLITCFVLFCILPTFAVILNFQSITLDYGYGLVNFMFLYLLGRYASLHFTCEFSKYVYLGLYLASMASMGLFQICYSKILGFDFDALISYDTIFIFVGSVSLFMYFRQLSFSNNLINKLAKTCLAVYVIHLCPLFCGYFFRDLLHVQTYTGFTYLLLLFVTPICIYLLCAFAEMCRLMFIKIIIRAQNKISFL